MKPPFSFQVDQTGSTANLISQKSSNLVEQVFNSSLFHQKESKMPGGLTSGKMVDPRMVEGRGRPIWTVDDRESRVTPFDLQVSFTGPDIDHIVRKSYIAWIKHWLGLILYMYLNMF